MKIGIDVSLTSGEKAGVGYYVARLVESLAEIDKQNNYTLYPFFGATFASDFKSIKAPLSQNFNIYLDDISRGSIEETRANLGIDNDQYFKNIELLHSTTFFIPKSHKGKKISTIYDLTFLNYPQFHTEANRLYCFQGVLDAVFYCEKIITISENTKQDLIKFFNVEPDRIIVTHLAASEMFKPVEEESIKRNILKKYKINKPFIFSLGSNEPRKNLSGLIQAYVNLDNSLKKDFDLVIAGGRGWLNSNLYSDVEKYKLQNNIKFIGYVNDEDLPVLYSSCSVFAYPSFYEGFGLPVLEAMACGAPVITSDNSSLKEIAEGAAKLVDPNNILDLTSAIQNVLSDDNVSSKLQVDGILRSSEFSWRKTAEKTLDVYRLLGAI